MRVDFTYQRRIEVPTPGRGLVDVTDRVAGAVRGASVCAGLCHVFLHHTSASLILCENGDPQVPRDLEAFFERLVVDGDPMFRHTAEGPDDMPAHVRSVLTGTSLTIPIDDEGRLDLGTWQGVYVWEQRLAAHRRRLTVTVVGPPDR